MDLPEIAAGPSKIRDNTEVRESTELALERIHAVNEHFQRALQKINNGRDQTQRIPSENGTKRHLMRQHKNLDKIAACVRQHASATTRWTRTRASHTLRRGWHLRTCTCVRLRLGDATTTMAAL